MFHDPATITVAKALLRGKSVSRAEAARQLEVSKTTLRRWFARYDPAAFIGKRIERNLS